MNHLDWSAVSAIASVVSMVAYVLTAMYVRAELKSVKEDRFLTVTNDLFSVWQSAEFMAAQLWLLHRMEQTTWAAFVDAHRADVGEAAFHRVGSYYDRVGTLVRMGLVNGDEILSTIGPYAIAVWQKIRPLVEEARRIENSLLFNDFERLLPACYECYVPNLSPGGDVTPFSIQQPSSDRAMARQSPGSSAAVVTPPAPAAGAQGEDPARFADPPAARLMKPSELRRRLRNGDAPTILDVRNEHQFASDPRTLPGAIRIPPEEIAARYVELPEEREIVVYCA